MSVRSSHQEAVTALRTEFATERGTLDKQRDSEAQRADKLQQALISIKSELAKAATQLAGEREAHRSTKSELIGVGKDLQGRTRERDRQAAQIAKLDERCAALDAALKRAEKQFGELVSEKDERLAEQAATMRELTTVFDTLVTRLGLSCIKTAALLGIAA